MRIRILAAATAAAIVAVLVPATAEANHSWANYHWARTSNPFTLRLDDNVTSAWDSYLNQASSDWNASSVLNTTVASGSFGSPASCSPATGRVEVCNYTYGNTGWLGIASIAITSGNHISRALVAVNDTYFNQPTYNTPAYRRLVMCQEVGHAFGLGHQDENQTNPNLGTCMDYTRNPAGPPSNEHPNGHDFSELQGIYSHTDSFNTPATAGLGFAGQSPATWGTLVSGSATDGVGLYLRVHSHGGYTLTYVTWA